VLFLCAGLLAHAAGKSTVSISEVGGLRGKMPLTFLCFLAAALSLAGFPLTAGFYSKDAILAAAFAHGGWAVPAGLAIAVGSAFYISRMLFLTFFGSRPEQKPLAHPHEAPPVMAVPVFFLSVGAVSVGWLGQGFVRMLGSGWPKFVPPPFLGEPSTMVSSAGLAAMALGAAGAYWLTMRRPSWDWEWRRQRPGLEALFFADLGWRRVPAACVTAAVWFSDKVGRVLDHDCWDAAIEGSVGVCRRFSEAGGRLATGSISDSLWWVMTGAAALLAWVGWT
jgi:NADH-quinone oxidoreductase subunit L